MMTQTAQPLTARLGFATPRAMVEAGLEGLYTQAMTEAGDAWRRLARWNPAVASYVVPNGFRRRVLMTFNLREAFHFCRLRSAPNAHFSVRAVALRMAEMLASVHPLFAGSMALPTHETWQSVVATNFAEL